MNEINEIWKSVEGYDGLYEVSSFGRVKSLSNDKSRKEKILKPASNGCGYLNVNLHNEGKNKNFLVHRLVASAFLENPGNFPEVNHKDEDKKNNSVDNLEWCTRAYNRNFGTRNERMAKAKSKPVLQFTKNGEFVKEWQSTNECGRNGFNKGHVVSCCLGKQKSHAGFIWRYK